MTIYIESIVNLRVYRASDKKDGLYSPRDAGTATQTLNATLKSYKAQTFEVAASGTESRNIDDIAAVKGFFIEASAAVTLLINGTITLTLVPMDSASGRRVQAFLPMAITTLAITNPSATATVTGELCFVGDLA